MASELREKIRECLEDGSKNTLEIFQACDNNFRIYFECRRMEEEGILRSWKEEGGPERGGRPRMVYALFYRVQR